MLCLSSLPLGCAFGTAAPDEVAGDATNDERALVRGKAAAPSQFPATVVIRWGCTAAKVGPKHLLLAAHCVHDHEVNQVRWDYQPGQRFDYGVGYGAEGVDAFGPFPPAIVEACVKEGGGPACRTARINVDFLRHLQSQVAGI